MQLGKKPFETDEEYNQGTEHYLGPLKKAFSDLESLGLGAAYIEKELDETYSKDWPEWADLQAAIGALLARMEQFNKEIKDTSTR